MRLPCLTLPLAFLLLAASTPSIGEAQSTVVVTPAAHAADSILSEAASRGFAGVALAMSDGAAILRKGYGLAQRETRTAFTPGSIVQIGSNTKDFTAVAILQWIAKGAIRATDSLARFFPDAPADKRGITIRHLLDHGSGLPLGIGADPELVTRDEFRRRVFAAKLEFAPGTSERYSNAGFSLLALLIEQLSGRSYDEYVQVNILRPAGMTNTGYALPRFPRERVAHGYSGSEDKGTILDFQHPGDGPSWTLRGNGGMLSTVDDMAAFYRTLYTTEVLLPADVRSRRFDPGEASVLAGSDLTSSFVFLHEPGAKLDLIIASNASAFPAPRLTRALTTAFGIAAGGDDHARAGAESANGPAIGLPETPAATTIRAYLALFAGADSATMEAFFRERVIQRPGGASPGTRASRTRDMAGMLGGLTPIAYTVLPDGRIEVRARGANGDIATFTFDIEPAPPHRIRTLGVTVG